MKQKIKRRIIRVLLVFLIAISIFGILSIISAKFLEDKYQDAINLYEAEKLEEAADAFERLGTYSKAEEYLVKTKSKQINNLILKEEYEQALQILYTVEENFDVDLANYCKYETGKKFYDEKQFENALTLFKEIEEYEDAAEYIAKIVVDTYPDAQKTVYDRATKEYVMGNYENAKKDFDSIISYKDSNEWIEKCNDGIRRKELATYISAGVRYSTAISREGNVLATSFNSCGQTSVSEWKNIVSISSFGECTIGLKSDGSVVCAGKINGKELDVSDWKDIIQVSAGERYIVGIDNKGKVYTAGHNGDGQCNTEKYEGKKIVYIATSWRTTVALTDNDEVIIVGHNSEYLEKEFEKEKKEWVNIKKLAIGGGGLNSKGKEHIIALTENGDILAIGDNSLNQCEVDDFGSCIDIDTNDWHTIAITESGSIVGTGTDHAVDFEEWKYDFIDISAGLGYTIGVTTDGDVLVIGYDEEKQQKEIRTWSQKVKRKYYD